LLAARAAAICNMPICEAGRGRAVQIGHQRAVSRGQPESASHAHERLRSRPGQAGTADCESDAEAGRSSAPQAGARASCGCPCGHRSLHVPLQELGEDGDALSGDAGTEQELRAVPLDRHTPDGGAVPAAGRAVRAACGPALPSPTCRTRPRMDGRAWSTAQGAPGALPLAARRLAHRLGPEREDRLAAYVAPVHLRLRPSAGPGRDPPRPHGGSRRSAQPDGWPPAEE